MHTRLRPSSIPTDFPPKNNPSMFPDPAPNPHSFSQGSAQAFAAFTTDLAMAKKVSLFLALAAPPRAKGLSSSYLSALVESNPRFIYLVFGRHSMLSSTLMWMKVGEGREGGREDGREGRRERGNAEGNEGVRFGHAVVSRCTSSPLLRTFLLHPPLSTR
jgi:hypothetical protein